MKLLSHSPSYLISHGSPVKFPVDGKRGNVMHIFKKEKKGYLGNYRPVSLTFVASKIMEQIPLETKPRHIEKKEVIGDSQHYFPKSKSYLKIWWPSKKALLHLWMREEQQMSSTWN